MRCKNCQEHFSDDLNYCPHCGFQVRAVRGQDTPESYEEQLARHRAHEQEALGETRLLGPLHEELRERGYADPVSDDEEPLTNAAAYDAADDPPAGPDTEDEEVLIEEARRLERSERIAESHRAIHRREEKAASKHREQKKRPGFLASFWKPSYTAAVVSVIAALGIYLIAVRMYQSSVYAFSETLNRNMYPEAGRQFGRFLADDPEDSQQAAVVLDNYLASLQDRYLRGDMMYAEMISALEHMTATELYQEPLNRSIDLFRQQTVNWQQTEQVYQNALTAASQNLYADAIRGFNDVLFRAGNYKDAGPQLASARASYRNYLEQEIKPFQDQGNYDEAARRLRLAADLMPNDQGIADMIQRNEILEVIALRTETLETVSVLQYQDDYEQAFDTIYSALDRAPTDEVLLDMNRQLREGYAEHIIRAADILLTSGRFDEAMSRIADGLALLPGHEGLREAMLAFDADAELPDPASDRGLRYLQAVPDPTPAPSPQPDPSPVPTPPETEPTTVTESTAEPTTAAEPTPEPTPTMTTTEEVTTTEGAPTTAVPDETTAETTEPVTSTATDPTTEATTAATTAPIEPPETQTQQTEPPAGDDGFTGPLGNSQATDAAGDLYTNAYVHRSSREEALANGPTEIVIPVNGQASRLVGTIAIGGNEELYTQTFVGIYIGGGGTADWAGSLSLRNDTPVGEQSYRREIDFSLEGIDTIWIYVETLQGEDVTTILDLEVIP